MRFLTLCLSLLCVAAFAADDDIQLAANSSGTAVVTGGEQYCLYIHDPTTLAVTARYRVPRTIGDLAISQDGSRVYMGVPQRSQAILVADPKNGEIIASIPADCGSQALGMRSFLTNQQANVLLYATNEAFVLIDMDSGETKHSVPRIANLRGNQAALSVDGKRLVIIGRPETDESQPTEKPSDDAPYWQYDGKSSPIYDINLASGTVTQYKTATNVAGTNTLIIPTADELRVINYFDSGVTIKPDGTTTPISVFKYGYGLGATPDGETYIIGALLSMKLQLYDVATGTLKARDMPKPLEGWPEYFDGIIRMLDDGSYIGTTSSMRIYRLMPDGSCAISKIY